jgi:hypothetical protein
MSARPGRAGPAEGRSAEELVHAFLENYFDWPMERTGGQIVSARACDRPAPLWRRRRHGERLMLQPKCPRNDNNAGAVRKGARARPAAGPCEHGAPKSNGSRLSSGPGRRLVGQLALVNYWPAAHNQSA